MTPQDKQAIGKALAPLKTAVITAAQGPDSSAGHDRMQHFCEQFKAIVPHVRIKQDGDTGFPAPALITGKHGNIAWQAVPQGKILNCFLQTLIQASEAVAPLDDGLETRLNELVLPADIRLYFADKCPHCPGAIQQLQTMVAASAKLRLTIIDAAMFPQSAERDGVRAVPTVIVDDQFRWSGQIDLQEVLTLCIERDPAQLSPMSLRQLIEEGAAETVARMMIDAGRCFPALVDLLAHDRWSVRLGAMVTVEYLAEADPALAAELATPLWRRFAQASPQAQGDMAHVLGQIPTQEAVKYLQRIVSGAFAPPAVEAAMEALEEMNTD